MAFPTTQVSTDNLDSSADDPSLARADLLLAVQNLNTIVSERGTAGGVALLNGSGELASSQLPSTYAPTQTLTLAPTTGVVKIEDVLRLQPLTTDDVLALQDSANGDVVFVTDGDSGSPCLSIYANSQWNVIPFNSGTIAKTVTATLAAVATITAIPD
jgi:hypothetical protein